MRDMGVPEVEKLRVRCLRVGRGEREEAWKMRRRIGMKVSRSVMVRWVRAKGIVALG